MSIITLEYILENLIYDMYIDDCFLYHGNIEYVTSHLSDGNKSIITISDRQPADIKEFVLMYKQQNIKNPSLTIEKFYKEFYSK